MKLTFFGTGSSTPTPHKPLRSYAGFSVETGDDFLLFDIGPGTIAKMAQAGIDILTCPQNVFISHYHLDHCLDLLPLTKARGLDKKFGGAGNSFSLFGPEGLNSFCEDIFSGVKKWNYMENELSAMEVTLRKETMSGVVIEKNGWQVTCAPIKHYNGVCYRLDSEGKSIVYSGDMGYDETICKLGENADLAILECSYPSKEENKGLHLCPEEIGELAKIGKFKHVVLTHLYPACAGREEELIKKVKDIAQCEVTVAYDFFTMNL